MGENYALLIIKFLKTLMSLKEEWRLGFTTNVHWTQEIKKMLELQRNLNIVVPIFSRDARFELLLLI